MSEVTNALIALRRALIKDGCSLEVMPELILDEGDYHRVCYKLADEYNAPPSTFLGGFELYGFKVRGRLSIKVRI